MTDRLKIGYLCDLTPLDPNLYSGGNARMYQALQAHVGDVTILKNSWYWAEPVRRFVHALPDALNLRLRWRLHLLLSRVIARGVSREVLRGAYDVLFCPYSFQSLARVTVPEKTRVVFTSDATPTIYKRSEIGQSFGSYLSVSRYFDPWVTVHEKRVMKHADLLVWPTDWVRTGAEQYLCVPQSKGRVVPWGANVPWIERTEPRSLGKDQQLELLLIGRDWWAKGGPLAREVLAELKASGINARLTVIGSNPPIEHHDEDMSVYPDLDKSDPQDFEQFETCLKRAHFLLNPSFESYGFAFCEAAAYGLPALCFNVGGVPVVEGKSGHLFAPGALPAEFTKRILEYLKKPQEYNQLTLSSRTEYETRLNWDAWGRSVAALLATTNEGRA